MIPVTVYLFALLLETEIGILSPDYRLGHWVNDKIQRTGFSLVLLFIGVVLAPGDGAATEDSIIIEEHGTYSINC